MRKIGLCILGTTGIVLLCFALLYLLLYCTGDLEKDPLASDGRIAHPSMSWAFFAIGGVGAILIANAFCFSIQWAEEAEEATAQEEEEEVQ